MGKRTYCDTDLQPANIMFSVQDDIDEKALPSPNICDVTWLKGVKPDNSAPAYLVTSQPITSNVDSAGLSKFFIMIGDMGGGMLILASLLFCFFYGLSSRQLTLNHSNL